MKQEIELKEGMTARIEGGKVVIEMAEFEPKDGDFLYWENGISSGTIILNGKFKRDGKYSVPYSVHIAKSGILYTDFKIGNTSVYNEDLVWRFATDSEKQTLLDALAKDGKQWNAEKKCVEQLRWRAKKGEEYYVIGFCANGGFVVRLTEERESHDDALFESGNYFKTESDVPVEAFQKVYDEFFANYKKQKP
jgi:hypothetical protein